MEAIELLLFRLTELADRKALNFAIRSSPIISSAAKYEIQIGSVIYYAGRLDAETLSDALVFFAINMEKVVEQTEKDKEA